jgi:regulator of sigma E protease
MTLVLSALAFVLLLTLLVIVHELGHFAVAKWTGITVEEFGFGLPPMAKKLFTWKGTLFSMNWIPFGGFVRLQGENSMDPAERTRKGSFASASIPARFSVLVAGVFMNFVVALALLTFGFWMWNWVPTYLTLDALREGEARQDVSVEWGLYVSDVLEGQMAEEAGVTADGVLKAIDGQEVSVVDEVLALQSGKRSVQYTLLYGEGLDEEKVIRVSVEEGKTGIALSELAFDVAGLNRSFAGGFELALRETWVVTAGTIQGIGSLLSSLVMEQSVPEGIAGIVGIAQLTHDSIKEGIMMYLRLVALLSLSLAVLNILPFPALDGGRVVFVLFEVVSGRPVNRRLEVISNGVGILFLMALMAAVTWNDILRIVSTSSS